MQIEFSGSSQVNMNTALELEMTKTQNGFEWPTDRCFELIFTSPYSSQDVYDSFDASAPPTCAPLYSNNDLSFTVDCSMKAGTTNTLQFMYNSFTNAQKDD